MKTQAILPVVALLLGALFTPSSFAAAEKKKSASEKMPEKSAEAAKPAEKPAEKKPDATPRPLPYQGAVDAVDTTAKTFTLRNQDGKEHVFSVSDKTQIIRADMTPATFDDIKVGEFVRGSRLKIAAGKWDAIKVIIGKKETAAKPGKADAPAANPSPTGAGTEKKTE